MSGYKGPSIGCAAPNYLADIVSEGTVQLNLNFPNRNLSYKLLFFIRGAFDSVSELEVERLNELGKEFSKLGCKIYIISVDSMQVILEWIKRFKLDNNINFIADHSRRISALFNNLSIEGPANRAEFLIDLQGIIKYYAYFQGNIPRDVHRLLKITSELSTE